MESKAIAPSSSKKKKTIDVNLRKETETRSCHVIAETAKVYKQDFVILQDEIKENMTCNIAITRKRGIFEETHVLSVMVKMNEVEHDSYDLAVSLGIFYPSSPAPIFVAFAFTATNEDGYLRRMDFSTGGTYLFTEDDSNVYCELEDILQDKLVDISSVTPCFLFPKTVRVTENVPLKLHVEIYPQLVKDRKYLNELQKHELCNPRYKLGFQSFLPSDAFSDFALRAGNVDILCHKCILSCRSTYFAKLFQTHARRKLFRNEYETMDVSDNFDAETIRMMIDFIYTSEIPILNVESTVKLLKAAKKFRVRDLQRVCVEYLKTEMDNPTLLSLSYFESPDTTEISLTLKGIAKDVSKIREMFDVIEPIFLNRPEMSQLHNCLEKEGSLPFARDIILFAEFMLNESKDKMIDFVRDHWKDFTSDFYEFVIRERPASMKVILFAIASSL